MNAKKFKETYLKWSKVVLICMVCILYAVFLCDHFLGFDFSRNMYMMSFIATGCVLAFLSMSWISVLNLENRFLRAWHTNVIDEEDEVTLDSIAECSAGLEESDDSSAVKLQLSDVISRVQNSCVLILNYK